MVRKVISFICFIIVLKTTAKRTKQKTNKYTSDDMQIEIVKVMSMHILREMSRSIQRTPFFSVMVDKTTDAANIEQVVICLRWVSETLAVHEDFIGLYEVASTGAEMIYFTIRDVLLRLNLPISKARKLGFVDVTEDQCYVVKQFLKGSDLFVSLPTGSGKSLCYWLLPGLCDTFRGKSTALEHTRDIEMKSRIQGVAAQMATFNFYFGSSLALYSFYATLTTSASHCKQKTCQQQKDRLLQLRQNSTLKAMCNDDGFWQRVTTMAKNLDIPDPELPHRRKSPCWHDDGCAPAFPLTGYKMYEKVEMLLLKAAASKPYVEELKHVLTFYGDDFDPLQLSTQLEVLSNYFSSKDKVVLSDIIEFFQTSSSGQMELLSQVTKLVSLLLVMPATNAEINDLEADDRDDDDDTDINAEEVSVNANEVADYTIDVEEDDKKAEEDQDEGEEDDENGNL
ncbi:hypothetical protein EMCRGX_G011196 [Ephydatia muelleri]